MEYIEKTPSYSFVDINSKLAKKYRNTVNYKVRNYVDLNVLKQLY